VTQHDSSSFHPASRALLHRLHGIVPSFHGHAHNRGCQLHWHPMYTEGVGLEDFEECERTFGKSNELAAVTRLASPYHRVQHIDEHFIFHDQDKHEMSGICFRFMHVSCLKPKFSRSGNFIFQNYRQALDKIETESHQLTALAARLKTTDIDYENYLNTEREHLQSLKSEPAEVQQAVDYMELLAKVQELKFVLRIFKFSKNK
jgi:KDZ transposase-like protein